MVTYFVIIIVLTIVKALIFPLTFVPNASLSASTLATIGTAGAYVHKFDTFLPSTSTALYLFFGLLLTVELATVTWKLIMWVIRRIPTQS